MVKDLWNLINSIMLEILKMDVCKEMDSGGTNWVINMLDNGKLIKLKDMVFMSAKKVIIKVHKIFIVG